uniref:Uncharacterized protein n=1 Tax=Panagrolaimus superbus TaxID=310955 RepID=A0A914Z1X9_9BILA
MATPANEATPEVPVIPCQTCAAPTITNIPPAAEGPFTSGTGSVAATTPLTVDTPAGPVQCLRFIVTCNRDAMDRVIQIGIDQIIGTALAGPSNGMSTLTATVVCNNDAMLEAQAVFPAGQRVTLSTAYCSITV